MKVIPLIFRHVEKILEISPELHPSLIPFLNWPQSAVATLEYHSAVSQLQRLLHHETLQLERLNEIFDALEEAGVWVPGMKTGTGWMHGVQANLEQIYNERDLYMSHTDGIEHLKYPVNQFRHVLF